MPKGVPRDGSRKSPKERAPKWPADPHVTELVVAKTVEVLKMPEVGGNPWQSRKLAETFRIVHEQLLSGRDKARLNLSRARPRPRPRPCPEMLAPRAVPLRRRVSAHPHATAHAAAPPAQALFYPLGEDSMPLTAGQMLRQVAAALAGPRAFACLRGRPVSSGWRGKEPAREPAQLATRG